MTRWNAIAAIFLSILVTACGEGGEPAAEKAVLATIENPDATIFGKFTLVGENNACLTFNARDSTGEYFGEQEAYLQKNVDGWSVIFSFIADHQDCIAATKQMLSKRSSTD